MYLFYIIVTSLSFIAVFLCAILQVFVLVCIMRLFVYDMLVNVIYYVHVCEQAR